MSQYRMRYFFDWGSGVCLWADNEETVNKYDYPIDISLLPVSENLKEYLEKLINWHDTALNWNDPGGDLLWDQEQQDEFLAAAEVGYDRLRSELDDEYVVVYEERFIL